MTTSHAGSQHLLITLLGTYFYGQRKPIPSAFLVRLLEEFDVTEVGARNSLSRVAKRGLLDVSKPGRRTYYRLSPDAHAHHAERLNEIVNFGADEAEWDGTWTVVMFSVAERERSQRHLIRQRLTTMRFGMLYDGVWVRPGRPPQQLTNALKTLDLQKATVLVGASAEHFSGAGDPIRAFELEELRLRYESFIASMAPVRDRVAAGNIGAADALLERTRVMNEWRFFPDNDALLPPEILPDGWPLASAREAFIEVYDGLALLADLRLRDLLNEHDSELAAEVKSLTSAELAAMNIPPQRVGPLTGMF